MSKQRLFDVVVEIISESYNISREFNWFLNFFLLFKIKLKKPEFKICETTDVDHLNLLGLVLNDLI